MTDGFDRVKADAFGASLLTVLNHGAAYLTRAAAPDNLAVSAQFMAVLGGAEDDVVACFRRGGGVPYERYARFHEVMAEESAQSVLSMLESHVLPLVPGLTERLTRGLRALDAGCGRGLIVQKLAARFPRSRFVGMDLAVEAIAYARAAARLARLDNVEYVAADLSDFDRTAAPESFDLIAAFDAIHDQAQPLAVLRGIHRALAPDGVYLMQDISGAGQVHEDVDHPLGTLLYTVSCMHCMTVSLAQGGEGLGAMWGTAKAREYLHAAGFRSITTHRLAHDVQNDWYVVTK
jgi:2-polyprenyl-3-methyl-5-hydroxy-6-metoxy-1,4-benzoquinol methylase